MELRRFSPRYSNKQFTEYHPHRIFKTQNENMDLKFSKPRQTSRTQEFFYVPPGKIIEEPRPETPVRPKHSSYGLRSPRNKNLIRFHSSTPNSPRYRADQFFRENRNKDNETTDTEMDFFINDNSDIASKVAAQILFNTKVEENNPEILKLSIIDLQHKRDMFNQEGKFQQAEQTETAIERARKLLLDAMKSELQSEEMTVLDLRSGHISTDFNIYSHCTEAKEEELDEKLEFAIECLKKKHERELKDHQEKWDSEQKKRLFNKTSPELRELRKQQERLLKARRFEEANNIGKEADLMYQKEVKENSEKHLAAFLESRNLLLKRQEDELRNLQNKNEMKKTMFRHSIETEKDKFKNREKVINYRKIVTSDKEKLWNTKKSKQVEFRNIQTEPKNDINYRVENPRTLGLPSLSDSIRKSNSKKLK